MISSKQVFILKTYCGDKETPVYIYSVSSKGIYFCHNRDHARKYTKREYAQKAAARLKKRFPQEQFVPVSYEE